MYRANAIVLVLYIAPAGAEAILCDRSVRIQKEASSDRGLKVNALLSRAHVRMPWRLQLLV